MKRILILCLLFICVITGCSKSKEYKVKDVVEYLEELNSYTLTSTMTMNKDSKTISMDITVDYLKPDYYKVVFGKENEQIILKNTKGVYVITPNLNKEFKFDGSWPTNSSHAYLLTSIYNDLKEDSNAKVVSAENELVLESKVNHKTNHKITKMNYVCDKTFKPLRTTFLDDNNNELIEVVFNSFTANPTLTKDYFSEDKYLNKDVFNFEENEVSITIETGYVIEGNVLEASKSSDGMTILCFSGEKPYTIVVNKVDVYSEVVAIEDFDDMVILECGLGLLKGNVFTYFVNDYEVKIYSKNLTIDELENISLNISLT